MGRSGALVRLRASKRTITAGTLAPHRPMSSAPTVALPDAWRVEVFRQDAIDDPEGTHALAAMHELGIESVTGVQAPALCGWLFVLLDRG